MKIALIADPHLSDVENTPQEEALSWALSELEALRPDACVWLGDITACGSPDAAMRFRKKTDALPFPSVSGETSLASHCLCLLPPRIWCT